MNKMLKICRNMYAYFFQNRKNKDTKGITLIALVITIVLNCCGAAMV